VAGGGRPEALIGLAVALLTVVASFSAAAQVMVAEAVYFAKEEKALRDFDINDPGNKLSLMGDLEGTSMIIKVKDPDGNAIGVFKPTSGNTSHISEIAAYRLCRRLDLPACLPAIPKTLDRITLDSFAAMLEQRRFKSPKGSRHAGHYELKEQFRQALIDRLREAESLDGALKTWVAPLVLYENLGRTAWVKKHPIYKYLRHNGPLADDEVFELRQCTRIYKPAGCYHARIPYIDLMEQFTGILIVDALIGNSDRFAGGNVHLFSLEARFIKEKTGRYRLPSASLLMLDNGAGFMQNPDVAMDLIRKDLEITRFSRDHYEALVKLRKDLRFGGRRVIRELGLIAEFDHAGKTFAPVKVFKMNLLALIRYMESLERAHGEAAWF